jgi:hypothetical protein
VMMALGWALRVGGAYGEGERGGDNQSGFHSLSSLLSAGLTTIVRDRLTVRRGRGGMNCPTM